MLSVMLRNDIDQLIVSHLPRMISENSNNSIQLDGIRESATKNLNKILSDCLYSKAYCHSFGLMINGLDISQDLKNSLNSYIMNNNTCNLKVIKNVEYKYDNENIETLVEMHGIIESGILDTLVSHLNSIEVPIGSTKTETMELNAVKKDDIAFIGKFSTLFTVCIGCDRYIDLHKI